MNLRVLKYLITNFSGRRMRIAITGGIGCGKSTVVKELLRLMPYCAHFDFDKSVQDVYALPSVREKLQRAFGTEDRKQISDVVFSNPQKMRDLDMLTRGPLQVALLDALQSRHVIVEFPLLLESAWSAGDIDFIVSVTCDDATQRERIARRDGATADKIERVIGAQFSARAKAAISDFVIDTSPTAPALDTQLHDAMRAIRRGELRQRALLMDFPKDVWLAVEHAYTEGHRHYHGLDHLAYMFAEYDRYEQHFNFPKTVRKAIWFHDFCYNTGAALYATNEARSARAMVELLREHAPHLLEEADLQDGAVVAGTVGLAAEFIMCTQGHDVVSPYLLSHPRARDDARLFLDIDLAILAAPEEICEQFDENIRKEFAAAYPEKLFASGRAKALRHFLERDRVFLSSHFASREVVARENLTRLIAKWEEIARKSTLKAVAH